MLHAKAANSVSLSNEALTDLNGAFQAPRYDRSRLKAGILHMSLGGFHRSHLALYVHNLLQQQPDNWMICAVGLLPNDKANIEAMQAQDNLYSVLERTSYNDELKVVGSIKETIWAPGNPAAVLERLSDPDIRIVSLTVTEKGYHYDDRGNLDFRSPAIQNDLKNAAAPQTAIGYIVAGLALRRKNGTAPFTVMSCDNLPGNGHLARKLILQFADKIDAGLKSWIEANVAFPNAMVDRITPVTTPEISAIIEKNYNITDRWPVVCEDFTQWVLEDSFCNGRPAFEKVGTQLVKEVEPYEKMKVRLLNGSHSALAYISYLLGYRRVDDAMADPDIRTFVRRYMDFDITPTVPNVPGIDLDAYKTKLIERFSNISIADQVQRLAEDGSRKIPNAIIPCIVHQEKTGGSTKHAALALAAWMAYMTGKDEQLKPIEIKDPAKEKFQQRMLEDPLDLTAVMGMSETFGPDIVKCTNFMTDLNAARKTIHQKGMREALRSCLT